MCLASANLLRIEEIGALDIFQLFRRQAQGGDKRLVLRQRCLRDNDLHGDILVEIADGREKTDLVGGVPVQG